MRTVSQSLILFAFWLLLSGHFDPFMMASGAVAAVVIAVIAQQIGIGDFEGQPIELVLGAIPYWPWLGKEIFKSGLAVAWVILDPALPISPRMMRVRSSGRTAVGIATYANSITLTPGTLTVRVDSHDRALTVHALSRSAAADLQTGEMDQHVRVFEGRT